MASWRHLAILWRFDLRFAMREARVVLFLVCFGLFWAFWIQKFASGFARELQGPNISTALGWLFDARMVELLQDRAPTLVSFYYIALTATPAFAILGACDQTASDTASKYLRFLILRVGRFEVYLARFLGAATIVGAAQILVGLCATVMSIALDGDCRGGAPAEVIGYGLLVTLSLVAYSISFVALMSLLSALVGTAALAAVAGLLGYVLLLLLLSVADDRLPAVGLARYLLPSGVKPGLLSPTLGPMVLAILVQPLYAAVFLAAGWRVFSRRDT